MKKKKKEKENSSRRTLRPSENFNEYTKSKLRTFPKIHRKQSKIKLTSSLNEVYNETRATLRTIFKEQGNYGFKWMTQRNLIG